MSISSKWKKKNMVNAVNHPIQIHFQGTSQPFQNENVIRTAYDVILNVNTRGMIWINPLVIKRTSWCRGHRMPRRVTSAPVMEFSCSPLTGCGDIVPGTMFPCFVYDWFSNIPYFKSYLVGFWFISVNSILSDEMLTDNKKSIYWHCRWCSG